MIKKDKKNNKQFISIPNFMFEKDENGVYYLEKLGTRGFTLYCLLLTKQVWDNKIPIVISQIHSEANLEGVKRINKFKQLLCNLKKLGLIECEELSEKTKANVILGLRVNKYNSSDGGYEKISVDFVNDYVSKISHIAFTIYCLLKKYHNTNLGNQQAGNTGYAQVSEEFIATVLGYKDRKTIGTHLKQLDKLIKIEYQKQIIITNQFGLDQIKYLPNKYFVKAKTDMNNKYYVERN